MAVLDNAANFVRGSVAASIASGDTTISVTDASEFPDPSTDQYNLVLWDSDAYPRPDQDPDVEVVRVTGRDTTNDDLTVSRGQEGTTAVSHPASSELLLDVTSKTLDDIETNFLADGQDFDGQGVSAFSNVASIDTDNIETVADHVVETESELQTAFSNLSVGDTVYIAPGTYVITSGLTINTDGVNVVGAGQNATTIRIDGGSNIYPLRIGNANAVNNIAVESLTIDGNEPNHSGPYDNFYHGIYGQQATDIVIRDVEVHDMFPTHTQDDTSNVTWSDANVDNGGGCGILFTDTCKNVWIDKCYTHDNDHRGIDNWADNAWVTNNVSLDNIDRGVSGNDWANRDLADGNKRYATRFVAANNRVTGGTFPAAGIAIRDGSEEAIITGNHITRLTDGSEIRRGIVVNDHIGATIANNVVEATRVNRYGIEANQACEGITISGNFIFSDSSDADNPRGGIHVTDTCTNVTITGNAVDFDNFVTNSSNGWGDGIIIEGSANSVVVSSNVVYNSNTTGNRGLSAIAVRGTAYDVTITNNQAESYEANCIVANDDAAGVSVVGNFATAHETGSAVALQGSGGNHSATGNRIEDTNGTGVFARGAPNLIIANNTIINAGVYGVKVVYTGTAPESHWFIVSGNLIDGVTNRDGIEVGTNNGIVTNNLIQNASRNGIYQTVDSDNVLFSGNILDGAATDTWAVDGTAAKFYQNTPNPAGSVVPSGTVIEGVAELSSAPTASNWDATDSGLVLVDTSVTPNDSYLVQQDGSLAGPMQLQDSGGVGAHKNGTDQTIPDDTTTTIELNASNFEDSNIATLDTTNNAINIQKGGTYEIKMQLTYNDLASGDQYNAFIKVNGSAVTEFFMAAQSSFTDGKVFTKTLELSSGDTVAFDTKQTSGADATLSGLERRTNFSVHQV